MKHLEDLLQYRRQFQRSYFLRKCVVWSDTNASLKISNNNNSDKCLKSAYDVLGLKYTTVEWAHRGKLTFNQWCLWK